MRLPARARLFALPAQIRAFDLGVLRNFLRGSRDNDTPGFEHIRARRGAQFEALLVGGEGEARVGKPTVGGASVEKIRHGIKPEITYSFIPSASQDNAPDFLARIPSQNSPAPATTHVSLVL